MKLKNGTYYDISGSFGEHDINSGSCMVFRKAHILEALRKNRTFKCLGLSSSYKSGWFSIGGVGVCIHKRFLSESSKKPIPWTVELGVDDKTQTFKDVNFRIWAINERDAIVQAERKAQRDGLTVLGVNSVKTQEQEQKDRRMIEYTVKVYANGYKEWYLNGELHREDGPAVEHANGYKGWYLNGELHREGGPACEYANGGKYWYLNGELHREDGPAFEYTNGYKEWYLNGKLHREDGPAIEYADGTKEWHLNGKRVSKEEHASLTRPTIEMTVAEIAAKLGHKIKVIEG